jgi:hypothetical protein
MNCNESCKPESLVKLISGKEVCTWCPEWARECEARRLLTYKKVELKEALEKREQIRGKEVTDALRAVMELVLKNARKK